MLVDLFQMRKFLLVGGHNQFSAYIVSDAVVLGELDEFAAAIHAVDGLQRSGLVIDTGVDHPAVMSGLVIGQSFFFLNQKNAQVRIMQLQFVQGSGTYNASADNGDVEGFFQRT
jgi:hypothetical protein